MRALPLPRRQAGLHNRPPCQTLTHRPLRSASCWA
jgi:hypothetical protein